MCDGFKADIKYFVFIVLLIVVHKYISNQSIKSFKKKIKIYRTKCNFFFQ